MAVLITATGPTALRSFVFPDADATMVTSLTTSLPSLTGLGTLTNLTVTNPITGSVTGGAAAGSLTGVTLAANVLASSLTSLGTLTSLALSGASALFTRDALAVTSTDGLVLQNTTPSTAGVPVQQSPRLRLRSNVWNTTTPANNTDDWILESVPVSAATPSGLFKIGKSLNGGATTYPFAMTSAGAVTTLSTIFSGADVWLPAGNALVWTGRAAMFAPAAAQFLLNKSDSSSGVGLDVATDAVLKVRTRAHTAYAQIDALGHSTGGVAGVATFGPAAVTSITVKGGIITAIS